MKQSVKVLMIGIGGYGHYYLHSLFNDFAPDKIKVMGVVDPSAKNRSIYQEVLMRKIPVFNKITDFYSKGLQADLVVISSPIQYHVEQSCIALVNGSNVLCDKPLAATTRDLQKLNDSIVQSGNWMTVGYQWSFSSAVQELKSDIIKGLYGTPVRFKTLCLWPRDLHYYNRNNWAGRVCDSNGRLVLDSPVNNAMAHFLHNLFYLSGKNQYLSSIPASVQAEVIRGYDIENYDSAALRSITKDGTEILFYGSHATHKEKNPIFHLEFEEAVVSLDENSSGIVAKKNDRIIKNYGSPDDSHQFSKLFKAVDMVGSSDNNLCDIKAAASQTICMEGVQTFCNNISIPPKKLIKWNKEKDKLWITGWDDILEESYNKGTLPGENGVSWIRPGKLLDLTNSNISAI